MWQFYFIYCIINNLRNSRKTESSTQSWIMICFAFTWYWCLYKNILSGIRNANNRKLNSESESEIEKIWRRKEMKYTKNADNENWETEGDGAGRRSSVWQRQLAKWSQSVQQGKLIHILWEFLIFLHFTKKKAILILYLPAEANCYIKENLCQCRRIYLIKKLFFMWHLLLTKGCPPIVLEKFSGSCTNLSTCRPGTAHIVPQPYL